MKTIWKFPFTIADEIFVKMPERAKILHVDIQDGMPCIWAEVESEYPIRSRRFFVIGTGHEVPFFGDHIATFQMPPFVWHLYGSK